MRNLFRTRRRRATHVGGITVDGDQAFVTYKCVAKDGKSFRNTEFFVFSGDKVQSIDVYFGAAYHNGRYTLQLLYDSLDSLAASGKAGVDMKGRVRP